MHQLQLFVKSPRKKSTYGIGVVFFVAMNLHFTHALADESAEASALLKRYASLEQTLKSSPFPIPLTLHSEESANRSLGEVYAIVEHPFADVATALRKPQPWCDVLILHLNVKYCRPADDADAPQLLMSLGSKKQQALDDTHAIRFDFSSRQSRHDYFHVELDAPKGPLSTRNFNIDIEAVATNAGHTLLHFTYAYEYGLTGRLAMKGYLATIGHDKVGFTVTGTDDKGQPEYVDGMRGLTERNTMRYYLAIDAYLRAIDDPARLRFERSLDYWFAATERFPRQLHEVERADYLQMKRAEYSRQQASR